MRRKFIAAAASGVLALTMTAALPTIHAAAVSIWNDITPGTESVETFQYKDYADRYSDAYELYGYDAEALFNHYETVGKAEGRVGRFKKTAEEDDRHPYVWDADEPLDPLPPLDFHAQPDWFDARTLPENLSNIRIVKEYEQLEAFIERDEWIGDPVLVRKSELLTEMSSRVRNYEGRRGGADYLRADDPEHSETEDRFIILGLSSKANLLVVCHCYRASDTVIRIISARKATKTESKYYGK